MRKKLMLYFGLIGTMLFAATAAADDSDIVPIDSLKPAIKMEKPVLTGTGGPLLLSDSPESPKTEGAYYRDNVSGSFRVFWHHQNMSGQPMTISVAVTNNTGAPVMLFSNGIGIGTNYYPDVAGQDSLTAFMKNRAAQKLEAVLNPGDSYFLDTVTADTYTTSGIAQFDAVSLQGHRDAAVTVTTLGYRTAKPERPDQMPILPGDVHVRGTFPHSDRAGTLQYNTSSANALIRISSSASGPYSDSMPGEYEEGYDAVDGGTVVNNGNYGVLYNLSVVINNEEDAKRRIEVYDNPSGGGGHYVVGWGKDLEESQYLNYLYAWKVADFNVNKKGKTVEAQLSLTGGAAGPQVLYFTNSALQ
ncbi:hypothetical protein [Paenibacillus humicola]|uniref:hypothetical protein n=1 Tax=Paenibacillus humicola TaxID=3110540 RepID=UPI00237BE74F|nr:hypothetical protein [Paenibacillus humicola]